MTNAAEALIDFQPHGVETRVREDEKSEKSCYKTGAKGYIEKDNPTKKSKISGYFLNLGKTTNRFIITSMYLYDFLASWDGMAAMIKVVILIVVGQVLAFYCV